MARKRRESDGGPGQPWLNTFADLMNLLLCFFVMLFAMSEVSVEKFNEMSVSMANSFGIFQGGGSSIFDGQLISSGVSQLNDLDEYYNNMGKDQEEGGLDEGEGASSGTEFDEALSKIQSEMKSLSEQMYDYLSGLTEEYKLNSDVELAMDPEYQFVQVSLRGSVLFDSGKADIKEGAKPIMARIGQVLEKFNDYTIEIEGHTDDVPMTSGAYKDNNWLSSARALSAAEYLLKNSNLNPEKLKYTGRGEYEPVVSNDTAANRAKNRRIEIKIYNEYSR
ncbi:MAG TPA: flagellar motor protein MotB [Clostridiales bacterium]|nr:flagellar motor protein MotB [Clostridiales bacterium]